MTADGSEDGAARSLSSLSSLSHALDISSWYPFRIFRSPVFISFSGPDCRVVHSPWLPAFVAKSDQSSEHSRNKNKKGNVEVRKIRNGILNLKPWHRKMQFDRKNHSCSRSRVPEFQIYPSAISVPELPDFPTQNPRDDVRSFRRAEQMTQRFTDKRSKDRFQLPISEFPRLVFSDSEFPPKVTGSSPCPPWQNRIDLLDSGSRLLFSALPGTRS